MTPRQAEAQALRDAGMTRAQIAEAMGIGERRAMQSMTFDKTDGLVLRAFDPIERDPVAFRRGAA